MIVRNIEFEQLNREDFIARCMFKLAADEDYSVGQFEVDTQLWIECQGIDSKKLWKRLQEKEFEAHRNISICVKAIMSSQNAKAGQARWNKLSKEERSKIAKKAVQARIKKYSKKEK